MGIVLCCRSMKTFVFPLCVQNIAPEARTINSVIRDCCECGQPDAGYKVFTRFRGVGLMPTTATFNHLINAYCDIGQVHTFGCVYRLLLVCVRDMQKHPAHLP